MSHTEGIGTVFTPAKYVEWCLETFRIYDAWRKGASLIEPTCGKGIFFLTLMDIAQQRGDRVTQQDLDRLIGIELKTSYKNEFLEKFSNRHGIDFPDKNFITLDFLSYESEKKFDIALGNPPWLNFTELPQHFKPSVKSAIEKYQLIKNRSDVLLGNTRLEIAGLIIAKCMIDHVKNGGSGFFFSPLSLIFNETANSKFRPALDKNNRFIVDRIVDFKRNDVFSDVSTRNGLLVLKNINNQEACIPYDLFWNAKVKKKMYCFPTKSQNAWRLNLTRTSPFKQQSIEVASDQRVRQGINTGGLNKVFHLEKLDASTTDFSNNVVAEFVNGFGKTFRLSTKYLFPLANAKVFGRKFSNPQKYILCLYNENGKILDRSEFEHEYGIVDYLSFYQQELSERKGVLIQSKIQKGYFWALHGVNGYTFKSWKVIWESLGKKTFEPEVVKGYWQGNQSLHSYISTNCKNDARRIKKKLNEIVPDYLDSFGMNGTCNWAQPSRINPLLSYRKEK